MLPVGPAFCARRSGIARQVALDPSDGLELGVRSCGPNTCLLASGPSGKIADLADRKECLRRVVETAVASFLSPDGSERMEAAFARRLDRLSRHVERLERDVVITDETLALFVRFWLTITPPLPERCAGCRPDQGPRTV